MNLLEMRLEVSIEVPDLRQTGINTSREFRVIEELRDFIRSGFQQEQRLNTGTK
jgi:hypothetical protein